MVHPVKTRAFASSTLRSCDRDTIFDLAHEVMSEIEDIDDDLDLEVELVEDPRLWMDLG